MAFPTTVEQAASPQAGPGEAPHLLYESATTRATRMPTGGGMPWVLKEALGPGAAQRQAHERGILERLQAVHGVARLATGAQPASGLALDYVDGASMAQMLQAGAIDLPQLLRLAMDLVTIIGAVHGAGVVHGDVNPANILLTRERQQPVLIDFDAALHVEQQHLGFAHHEKIAGTLAYVAPEQTGRTGRPVDCRADLYALGATLYEMATGRPPFETQDPLQLIHDHLVREPVAPARRDPRVPQALSDIVLRLLAKEPDQRYQSAQGLAHDLALLRSRIERGITEPFALGERDFAARLLAPSRPVGRQHEIVALHQAFENALHGGSRGVLISGGPGVGKTTLINELRPVVAARRGWLVSGKFDSQRQDLASDAVFQCLRALGRLLLTEPEDELRALRASIRQMVGPALNHFMRRMPEMDLLLQRQPNLEVDPNDPLNSQERMIESGLLLLRTVASPARPLVMVLDNLQWAAPLPLAVIHAVLTDDSLSGVLLVCAFRDDALDPAGRLAAKLARWQRLDPPPPALALRNLADTDLAVLLAEMLRLSPQEAQRLAAPILAQTEGNPFDTVQLLDGLRRAGALVLGDKGWAWDDAMIRRHIGTGSVARMLSARIDALAPEARELVDVMACLGGDVELALLQVATGLAPASLQQRLAPAVEDGLLALPQGSQATVRFQHDRVQQAALEHLPGHQRRPLQLALARRLAAHPEFEAHAAHQFLPVLDALEDGAERLRVARLLRTAAQALQPFNPAAAERFLAGALVLLARSGVPAAAQLPLMIERHGVLYNLGQLAEADRLYGEIEGQCEEPLQLTHAACVQICSLTNQGRHREAVDLGEAVLTRLGLALPAPGQIGQQLAQDSTAFSHWLDPEVLAADLLRPDATDLRALAAGRILNRMMPPSFSCDPKILAGMVLLGQRLWIEHGPAAEFVGLMSHASVVNIGARQDYRTAHAIGRGVLRISEARGWQPETSQSRFLFALVAAAWREPLEHADAEARRARAGLLEGGDLQNACFTFYASLYALLDVAPLERYAAETDAALALCARTGNDYATAGYLSHRLFARSMRSETSMAGEFDDPSPDAASHIPLINFLCLRALSAAIFGDRPALIHHAAMAFERHTAMPGTYLTATVHLVQALALAQQAQDAPDAQRGACLQQLDACREWLARRAADAPVNFLHLLDWIAAERAWATGDFRAAATAFDTARQVMQGCERPWQRALLCERAALFLLAHGLRHSGEQAMHEAHGLYAAWGAPAKVRAMESRHGFLRSGEAEAAAAGADGAGTRRGARNDSIDTLALLRASQALSSETNLTGLKTRVVELLGTMTGATSVLLALRSGDQWSLAAASGHRIEPMPIEEAGRLGLLPLPVFHYAERTMEPLLVEDAAQDDRFAHDPYIARIGRCSLLAYPILSQGVPRAMLLLENRQSRGAFSAGGLDAVVLIASQLAVSLENALLYQELEQRVQQRTAELRAAQAELVATARKAGMAEIATNVLHNVGNILNSVNVSAALVAGRLRTSRAQGLQRAVNLLEENAGDLGGFLAHGGKQLPAYLAQLARNLTQEREEVTAELERLTRSIDHIKNVVATQQSYAGGSSMLEVAQICELVEDALRIDGDALAGQGVAVEKEFEAVPLARLDRTRTLQILVNLISNARHAMHGCTPDARRMTLQVGIDGSRIVVRVRDEGEGIPQENLARIFTHGFTTREGGHGFGLHSCALAAKEMGGTLSAHSDGPGRGAAFTLALPIGTAQAARS